MISKLEQARAVPITWMISAILVCSPLGASARCVEGEVIESSDNKVFPAKIADHVGHCTHHASRDLLHQELCRRAKSPSECVQPAVADFLEMDAQKVNSPSYHGSSDYALVSVLRRKTIAAEDCLSLEELYPVNPNAKELTNYNAKFRAATESTFFRECVRQGQSEEKCRRREHSSEDGWKILHAAVKRYKAEKNCPENAIPPLFLGQTRPDSGGLSASENLNKILRSGTQTKIVTTDPHALVVSNYRVICLKGKETLQYQTLDSLHGTRWSGSKDAGDWIDGESLVKKLDRRASFITIETAKPMGDQGLRPGRK